MAPVELIPLPAELVSPWQDTTGRVWYDVTHPYNGGRMRLPSEDVLHYKGYTRDGLRCISVLMRAGPDDGAGLSCQEYQGSYYANGGQPSGVLSTEADLGGYVKDRSGKNTGVLKKDALRKEWERIHVGPDKAYKIAIMDHGLTYTPISATMADAKYVENHDVTVLDICNFFGVPAYKSTRENRVTAPMSKTPLSMWWGPYSPPSTNTNRNRPGSSCCPTSEGRAWNCT